MLQMLRRNSKHFQDYVLGSDMQYDQVPQDESSAAFLGTKRKPFWKSNIGIVVLSIVIVAGSMWFFLSQVGQSGADRSYEREQQLAGEKHLVIASTRGQDVGWTKDIPSDWTIKRYIADDPAPDPAVGLPVPKNFGRESMAYLTYIIDHYDDLPPFVAFVHGHERSWHQVARIPYKVRALNLTALYEEDYISFRCESNMGCERIPYLDTFYPNWKGENNVRGFWDYIVPNEPLPRNISYKCCAQHAVTRKAIRARTKEDWIRIRSPLLRDLEDMRQNEEWAQNPELNEWLLGMFYEKYWHVLFGVKNGDYCPSLETCRQRHFSNAIICDGDSDTVPYEGTLWEDVHCKTPFDDISADKPANWTKWYHSIPAVSGDLRKAKLQRHLDREAEWQRRLDEAQRPPPESHEGPQT